jgi:hypothetical protein
MISPNIKRAKSNQSGKVQSPNFPNTTLSINQHHQARYVQHKLNIISKLLIQCKPSISTGHKIRASAVQVWWYLTYLYALLSHFLLQYDTIEQENDSRDISMPLVDVPRRDGHVDINKEKINADNVCRIMSILQISRANCTSIGLFVDPSKNSSSERPPLSKPWRERTIS